MEVQKQEVEGFFNEIAVDYKSKYSSADAFHHYFFNERLAEATKEFDFKDKKILDVGAGTGDLYDYLIRLEPTVDYYAVDVAANMLEQSRIPLQNRFVGFCYEVEFPLKTFDYIFMLGVTTYLDDEEINKTFDFIYSSLAESGKAIVTFTNQSSMDWKSRKVFKLLAKNFMSKRYVLSQEFKIYPRTLPEIKKIFQEHFQVEDIRWLNHTIFPFNQVMKKLSVKTAEKLHQKLKSESFLKLLSSDFLLVLSKKE